MTSPHATEFPDGIEWFAVGDDNEDCQCARCGSSCAFLRCPECAGEGCPDDDFGMDCRACTGRCGSWRCISTPSWCEANPLPGRAHIPSTALEPRAWND